MKIEITPRETLLLKNGLRSQISYCINHAWDEFTQEFLDRADEYTALLKKIEDYEQCPFE